MEKKNYVFRAYDSKGKEIKLLCANVFYDITEEEAKAIKLGLLMGLTQKYKEPRVTYKKATEEELKEYEEGFCKFNN